MSAATVIEARVEDTIDGFASDNSPMPFTYEPHALDRQSRASIVAAAAGSERMAHIKWLGGHEEVIDLCPLLVSHRRFSRVRESDTLFQTLRVGEGGAFVEWADGTLMDSASVAILPEFRMTNAEFRQAMELLDVGYEGMASQLGVSKRLIGELRSNKVISNHVSLAVRYLLHLRRAKHQSPTN